MARRFRLAAFCVLSLVLAALGASARGGPRVIAYFNDTSLPLTTGGLPTIDGYSHYNISFVWSADGTIGDLGYDAVGTTFGGTVIRQDIARQIVELQSAGKKVMLAFGGSAQNGSGYATMAQNVPALAASLANFVKNPQVENNAYSFQFDGIDIDWEESNAFLNPAAAGYDGREFLKSLTTELRDPANLPKSGGWLLSHAPQPPYLSGQWNYSSGGWDGYVDVLENVGDEIDWINMQYYNNPGFTTAAELVYNYHEIVNGWAEQGGGGTTGIPAFSGLAPEKLVLGKPDAPGQAGSGYLTLDTLLNDAVDPLYAEYGDALGGVFFWQLAGEQGHDPYWGDAVAAAVPEPASLALLTFAALAAFRRRRPTRTAGPASG